MSVLCELVADLMIFKVREFALFSSGFKYFRKYPTLHDIIFENQLV